MRYIRRGIAFLLLLALLFTTALAEAPFLRHSDGWTLEGVPLEAVLTADVTSLMPYDEDRLAMLTPVTDVLSLHLRAGEEQGSVTILVGRTEALTLSYQGDEAQLSCIPEMSFRSQEDVVDKLLGGSTEVTAPYGLRADAETLLDDGWVLLESTLTSFEGWGKRKSVKTNITDMGMARTCTASETINCNYICTASCNTACYCGNIVNGSNLNYNRLFILSCLLQRVYQLS